MEEAGLIKRRPQGASYICSQPDGRGADGSGLEGSGRAASESRRYERDEEDGAGHLLPDSRATATDVEKLKRTMRGTVEAMARIGELRDPHTAGHQRRVAHLALGICREMHLPTEQTDGIYLAAAIHDIGKIGIPAEILSKPGPISNIELLLIKTHPGVGHDLLRPIDFPWPIAEIVLQHHERLNGSGYPAGLAGQAICLEARIVAVADVVEATASHRPYRPALGIEKALDEISEQSGVLYDPAVVNACCRLFRERQFELL